jgi:hypothetical protein
VAAEFAPRVGNVPRESNLPELMRQVLPIVRGTRSLVLDSPKAAAEEWLRAGHLTRKVQAVFPFNSSRPMQLTGPLDAASHDRWQQDVAAPWSFG